MKHLVTTFCTTTLLFTFFLAGCISVEIPSNAPVRTEKIDFKAPTAPFAIIKTESADHAWQSSKTENTIFFISDCNPNADAELSSLASDMLGAMTDVKVLETNDREIFNERAALEISAKGKIDGVTAKIWLVVFKKNGCNFTLSLTGSDKSFETDRAVFQNFKNNFKVGSW